MEYKIKDFEPAEVFRFFEEISAIPRPSGREEKLCSYLCAFAREHGLVFHSDGLHNVVIKKPGSKGCEALPAVMLQGHQDMVCEKRSGVVHDFDRDGICLAVNGHELTACGTTLGADNGIAVAMMLALLSDKSLKHPPLECVFTVQEEVGLIGAAALDPSLLSARTMINLDSEEEGVATVSCAGGLRARLSRKIQTEDAAEMYGCAVTVGGLAGGHSGTDIDAGRSNANKLTGQILNRLLQDIPFRLSEIQGGNKDNAIPRGCTSVLVFTSPELCRSAIEKIGKYAEELKAGLSSEDAEFFCTCEPQKIEKPVMSEAFTRELIALIKLAPNGVQSRNPQLDSFVVSSVNFGVIQTEDGCVTLTFSPRSSVEAQQEKMKDRLKSLADAFGYSIDFSGEYPGWAYAEHSPIREVCCQVYRKLFGKELKTEAIHAGLECGLFSEKLPGLDAIAIGPDMRHVHTPDETLDMASCERVYRMIKGVLNALADQREA